MGPLVSIETERRRERPEHLVGRVARVALLQARVVRRTDAGEQGQLLAAEALHPPAFVLRRETTSPGTRRLHQARRASPSGPGLGPEVTTPLSP